jgi:hypothetical protein
MGLKNNMKLYDGTLELTLENLNIDTNENPFTVIRLLVRVIKAQRRLIVRLSNKPS